MKRRTKNLLLLFAFVFVAGGGQTAVNAQPKPPFKIRLATSTAGLDFAPIWIAQRKGYFKEEGIDFEHILTTGGAVTMAAVMNGDVQFVSTAASDVLVARSRGDRLLSVGIFPASLEWHIATNNKWLESRGLAWLGTTIGLLDICTTVWRRALPPLHPLPLTPSSPSHSTE